MNFKGHGAATVSKQKIEAVVLARYPDIEPDVPVEKQKGHMPDNSLKELQEADEERATRPQKKRTSMYLEYEKSAPPGDVARALEICLDDIRPNASTIDKHATSCTDPETKRRGTFERFALQTDRKPIPQWESKWISFIRPDVIPRMCSGPDFDKENR